MISILPILVIFFAVFTQSLAGFGVALIAMALLPALVGIRIATPLVALIGMTIEFFLTLRYRSDFNLKSIWRFIAASLVGIPVGILALTHVSEEWVTTVLGLVLTAYALYALFSVRLPTLAHNAWAYGFGLLAGMLGGAYNTSGPPVIVYGHCRGWSPGEFKSNLQGFFFINSAFVVLGHFLSGNYTGDVWLLYLWSLPALALGIVLGVSLDRFINPAAFRKLVLVLLVVMGIRLIF